MLCHFFMLYKCLRNCCEAETTVGDKETMLARKSVEDDAPSIAHRLARETRLQANEQKKKQEDQKSRIESKSRSISQAQPQLFTTEQSAVWKHTIENLRCQATASQLPIIVIRREESLEVIEGPRLCKTVALDNMALYQPAYKVYCPHYEHCF